jgi:glutathione peroxidase
MRASALPKPNGPWRWPAGAVTCRERRARACLDDARNELLRDDDPIADSSCAHAFGMVQSRLSEFSLARASFERALRLRRRLSDDDAIAATLNSLGVLHLRLAQPAVPDGFDTKAEFERALGYFNEVRTLAERAGDVRLALLSEVNIAGALGGLGRVAEALERFLAQIDVARAQGDRHHESLILANAGEACRLLGDYARSRALCEEALAVAQATASKVREQQAHLQLSLTCEATGEFASALRHYKAHHALERETHAAEGRRIAQAQAMRAANDRAQHETAKLRRESRDLKRENRVLERQAREDPLTGLANRRVFDEALEARLVDARAAGRPLAVVLFDIDRFKSVNDRFTHAAGDAVLREVAALLRAHCRASDIAARIGGEEFVLLLRDAARDSALAVAERVRAECCGRDWSAIAPELAVTISAGLPSIPATVPAPRCCARPTRRFTAPSIPAAIASAPPDPASPSQVAVGVESRPIGGWTPRLQLRRGAARRRRMPLGAALRGIIAAGVDPHPRQGVSMASIYDFTVKDIRGKPVKLDRYRKKVMLVVNTASECGFTPQYKGLESLYDKFHDKGLEVLGFPCNQFGAQEPGDEKAIAQFCELNYGVTFPLFSKVDVNGEDAAPLYKYLKAEKPGLLGARPSSGTSPSSWSIARATSSSATRRTTRRNRWRAISRRSSDADRIASVPWRWPRRASSPPVALCAGRSEQGAQGRVPDRGDGLRSAGELGPVLELRQSRDLRCTVPVRLHFPPAQDRAEHGGGDARGLQGRPHMDDQGQARHLFQR